MRSRTREVKSIVLITDFELELIADGGDARGRKKMRITTTLPLCTRYQKHEEILISSGEIKIVKCQYNNILLVTGLLINIYLPHHYLGGS